MQLSTVSDNNVIDGIDYGPLACLVGKWEGDTGQDVAPEPDGIENNPYYETISFEAIGDISNAETQTLAAVRYLQIVRRKSTNKVFHDQTGYWMWDASAESIMQSLTIPRAVCLVAGGSSASSIQGNSTVLEVRAALGDKDWGIVQSPFMQENARTVSFTHRISVGGDRLTYAETTVLDIYGKRFDHTDGNTLIRSR